MASFSLTAIGFSPWTTRDILNYCEKASDGENNWYWDHVKSGIQDILFYRKVALFCAFSMACASIYKDEGYLSESVVVLSALGMCYSLSSIYSFSKKIHIACAPHLKIKLTGAKEGVIKKETDYGTITQTPLKKMGAREISKTASATKDGSLDKSGTPIAVLIKP